MYSRCSDCLAVHEISAEQLRNSRGLLQCASCAKHFDALATLSERAEDLPMPQTTDSLGLTSIRLNRHNAAWLTACLLASMLLLGQVCYFETETLSQKPLVRHALQWVCDQLPCRLPGYKNPAEWSVSHTDFQTLPDNILQLTAAMTNQAEFPQALPDMKLVLLNFNQQVLAERVFSATQYSSTAIVDANDTVEIKLTVVPQLATAKVGGYRFTFL